MRSRKGCHFVQTESLSGGEVARLPLAVDPAHRTPTCIKISDTEAWGASRRKELEDNHNQDH